MKISEAFDAYKNNYMFYKTKSKRVLENHEYVKKRLIFVVGDKDIGTLTLEDVQNWTIYLLDGRCWNTVRNDIIRLRAVLKYLKIRCVNCLEPELIPIPKRETVTKEFLTAEEVSMLIEKTPLIRTKFVISLLYSSGIRLSELLSLNRGSIANKRFRVIGKGDKERLCFTDDRTIRLMGQYLKTRDDDCPALLVNRLNKERMTPTNVQLLVKNAAKKAGIDKKVTPHTFRHSYATNFIMNDGNIRYLSTLLGHASVSTTMIYTHIVDNELENQYRKYHTT